MRRSVFGWIKLGPALALGVGLMLPPVAVGDQCANNDYYEVCADWNPGTGTPVAGTDFDVVFYEANPPDVLLRNPRTDWTIRVTLAGLGAPASLATVTTEDDGDYTLNLVGPSDTPGAVNVGFIDLTPSGNYQTSIGTMIITGDLGGLAVQQNNSAQGGNVDVAYVGGDLLDDVYVENEITTAFLIAGTVDPMVTFYATKVAAVAAVYLGSGDFEAIASFQEIGQDAFITIAEDLAGSVYVSNVIESGNMHGIISAGNITGEISIDGTMQGFIDVEYGNITGEITIDGDLEGTIIAYSEPGQDGGDIEGVISVGGDMTDNARIWAHGSLVDGASIVVSGEMDATSGIAIDADGWQSGETEDLWECGATITVDSVEYEKNTPAARVYNITQCLGDMNNNCTLDNFDIDPFVLALTNPGQFGDSYPGLDRSCVYHGDFNLNGTVDNGDVDPFIAAIAMGCSSGECDDCGMAAEAAYTAGEVAELLITYVAEQRFNAARAVAGDLAQNHARLERREFWADVFGLLNAH